MSRFMRFGLVLTLVGMLFVAVAPAAQADPGTFDITVKHNINGEALGLDKSLPVEVCVNGGPDPAFSFEFKDTVEIDDTLMAGVYTFTVHFEDAGCNSAVIMSLGPVDIPAGADVNVRARLGAGGAPTLSAKIR